MNKVRCAIYTRKSSEEGLDQAFNSLDAQREACAAYILSQASEGWLALPAVYDDGGLSGGTLERPALKRLLADVADGGIDIIVVYKVDRLTRSLFDFAKLVETFDKAGTSFVSVTQSFNTTTSMGRLTLNMLLSFAQFEREVTAERIRDKIAASKAKGMWMGGTPPLGYRPDGRTLAMVDAHADLVRHLYQRYFELGHVRALVTELHAKGILIPERTRINGRPFGGGLWSRGQVYSILKNPIYVGEIHHRGQIYQGKHPAIIDRELWDRVQSNLYGSRQNTLRARSVADISALAGKVFDENNQPLIASHANKRGVRYRYYVSKAMHHCTENADGNGWRVPARELETAVARRVSEAFAEPLALLPGVANMTPTVLNKVIVQSKRLADRLKSGDDALTASLIERVGLTAHSITIRLTTAALASNLGVEGLGAIDVYSEAQITRCGRAVKLLQGDGQSAAAQDLDVRLIRLIAKARLWWSILATGKMTVTELAAQERVSPSYPTRVTRLAFLAPDIVDAITTGTASPLIDVTKLLASDAVAICWDAQRRQLGQRRDVRVL
jgi:site-specific DNA recombinase